MKQEPRYSFLGLKKDEIKEISKKYNLNIENEFLDEFKNSDRGLLFENKSKVEVIVNKIICLYPKKEFYNLLREASEIITWEIFEDSGWYKPNKKTLQYVSQNFVLAKNNPNHYDVFISYNHEEAGQIADQISNKLEENHFKVFKDSKSLHIGNNIESKINEAINKSLCGIVLLGKKYLSSKWCKYELTMFSAKNITSNHDVIIPIIIDGEYEDYKDELPTPIKELLVGKFEDKTIDDIQKKIMNALRKK